MALSKLLRRPVLDTALDRAREPRRFIREPGPFAQGTERMSPSAPTTAARRTARGSPSSGSGAKPSPFVLLGLPRGLDVAVAFAPSGGLVFPAGLTHYRASGTYRGSERQGLRIVHDETKVWLE